MQPSEKIRRILWYADEAVKHEITSETRPVSAYPGPDGEQQLETMGEYNHRVALTAIMYCIENGLLRVPESIECDTYSEGDKPALMKDRARLELPLKRHERDGVPGLRLPDGSYTA